MRNGMGRTVLMTGLVMIAGLASGCATYQPLTRPVPKLSVLSPEGADLPDPGVEKLLHSNVKLEFPVVLAVAKVQNPYPEYAYEPHDANQYALETPQDAEADGWRSLGSLEGSRHRQLVRQVSFITPALMSGNPTLKKLRDAAARMRAPLLLVYLQQDHVSDGYKDGAYTIGCYSACQAALVDTRTGVILATANSAAQREENVFPLGTRSARERIRQHAREETAKGLQKNFSRALVELDR